MAEICSSLPEDELPSLENSPRREEMGGGISKVFNDTLDGDEEREISDEEEPHSSYRAESKSLSYLVDAYSERTEAEQNVLHENKESLNKSISKPKNKSIFQEEEKDQNKSIIQEKKRDKDKSIIEGKKRLLDSSSVEVPKCPPAKKLKGNADSCVDDLDRESEPVLCIPLNQVTGSQKKLAEIVSCDHCKSVPLDPYVSDCTHIFCKNCVEEIAESGHQCRNRGRDLQYPDMNISEDNVGIYKSLLNTFTFKCKNMCGFLGIAKDLLNHELVCVRRARDEMLDDFQDEKRLDLERLLENLIEYVDQYCDDNEICKEFTLFYSLRRFLKLNGDKRRVELLMKLWKDSSGEGRHLSPEECLALKVFNGHGKKMYQCFYSFLKRHLNVPYLKSPKQVEQLEQLFYPPSTDFSLESDRKVLLYKKIIDKWVEPSDLGELISSNGYQWKLTASIAKTLQEIAFEFQETCSNQPDVMISVTVYDKYDVITSPKFWRLQEVSRNSSSLIQYSFCISSVSLMVNGKKTFIYGNKETDDRIYRTIAVALPDDSLKNKMKVLENPIEEEKRNLIDKMLIVRLSNGLLGKFSLSFPSMVDSRKGNSRSVLSESSEVSEHDEFCRFCDSTAKSWLENMGSCTINENLEGILARCVTLNLLNFDVHFVKLFHSILEHETSGVYKSLNECNDHEKELLNSARQKIQNLLILKYSIEPDSLILEPHKYVNIFFKYVLQSDIFLSVIDNKLHRANVRQMFWRFFELRSVYADFNSGSTSLIKKNKLRSFKYRAVIWMKFIWTKFPYVNASSYLHLLVEHLEDILQLPTLSLQSMSGSAVDGSSNVFNSLLVEYLKSAWLKSSPYLRKIGLPSDVEHAT